MGQSVDLPGNEVEEKNLLDTLGLTSVLVCHAKEHCATAVKTRMAFIYQDGIHLLLTRNPMCFMAVGILTPCTSCCRDVWKDIFPAPVDP